MAPLSNYLASRIKKDFRQGNTVLGGIFAMVNRLQAESPTAELLPGRAVSLGADFLHQWDNRNYFVEVQSIASHLKGSPEAILVRQLSHNHRFQRPDADHLEADSLREQLAGTGSAIKVGKKGGRWTWSLEAEYRSPGLNLNDMGYISESDYIGELAKVDYQMNEPGRRIRNYTVSLYHGLRWSFGGENTYNTARISWHVRNNSLWSLLGTLQYGFPSLDTRELCGGPAMRHDGVLLGTLSLGSNTSKDLYGRTGYTSRWYEQDGSSQHRVSMDLTWLPVKRFRISGQASIEQQHYHQQYVTSFTGNLPAEYVVGRVRHHTTYLTLRGELFLTPELSIQYYGSPYYSVGNYRYFIMGDLFGMKGNHLLMVKLNFWFSV